MSFPPAPHSGEGNNGRLTKGDRNATPARQYAPDALSHRPQLGHGEALLRMGHRDGSRRAAKAGGT